MFIFCQYDAFFTPGDHYSIQIFCFSLPHVSFKDIIENGTLFQTQIKLILLSFATLFKTKNQIYAIQCFTSSSEESARVGGRKEVTLSNEVSQLTSDLHHDKHD